MNNLKFVKHMCWDGEEDEYLILEEFPAIDYTLLIRESEYDPYVAAWGFDKEKNCWSQGHYFSKLSDAMAYIYGKLGFKFDNGPINGDRISEIATMALHKLVENDKDAAYRFFFEEIEMSTEEVEFFGLTRNRKAVNIVWEEEGLPSEVDIPTDVDTDDVLYYLEETKNGTVVDYEIEEEDE